MDACDCCKRGQIWPATGGHAGSTPIGFASNAGGAHGAFVPGDGGELSGGDAALSALDSTSAASLVFLSLLSALVGASCGAPSDAVHKSLS